ncbi:unknown [Bacteroides sp. CAG:530]|nr:unknown [Bacteroides sp. CAG:530]
MFGFNHRNVFLPIPEGALWLIFKNNIHVKVHVCAIIASFILVKV